MSIEHVFPRARTVDGWRAVLHDLVDDVLDRILLTAEAEWEDELDGWWDEEDEPPGDPPPAHAALPPLDAALRTSLAAEIGRGTAVWGCDGTLRCTRRWAERILDRPEALLDAHRRAGRLCDCDVLRDAVGPAEPRPRCPRRRGGS